MLNLNRDHRRVVFNEDILRPFVIIDNDLIISLTLI